MSEFHCCQHLSHPSPPLLASSSSMDVFSGGFTRERKKEMELLVTTASYIQLEAGLERGGGDTDSWIRYAVKKDVEVVEIDLVDCRPPATLKYDVPSWVLRGGSVTSLKLISCNVGQHQINMRALRCLFLSYVDLDEAMARNILAGGPVLEALSVKHCVHLRELRCDSPQLKRLKVSRSLVGGPKLRVICPHVTSLSLSGWIEVLKLENISSVEEITFDFRNFWIFLRD